MLTPALARKWFLEDGAGQRNAWLALLLVLALLHGLGHLGYVFSGPYVIQDDVRQHVFWMQRFDDPALFRGDYIADYFSSLAPWGYRALYWIANEIGLAPLTLSKILPVFIGLAAAWLAYRLSLLWLAVPGAAFAAALLLNQSLWLKDDITGGTPRAFVYLILLGFLYALSRRSFGLCVLVLALGVLFYPQVVPICLGLWGLSVLRWRRKGWPVTVEWSDLPRMILGVGAGLILLLFYVIGTADYGPVLKASEAGAILELQAGGTKHFFEANPLVHWLFGERSGFIPDKMHRNNPLILLALMLPFALRHPEKYPLMRGISPQVRLLGLLLLAGTILFFASHVMLFELYLPSRYTRYVLRIVLCFGGGYVLWAWLAGRLDRTRTSKGFAALGLWAPGALIFLVAFPLIWASFDKFPRGNYEYGAAPELYRYLADQPKDSVVATLSEEGNMIPTFSARAVVAAREYGNPYQSGYYRRFRERTGAMIRAHYSPDQNILAEFIQHYGVTHFVLDRDVFGPDYLSRNRWARQYQPEAGRAVTAMREGDQPALATLAGHCTVLETSALYVVDALCILQPADAVPDSDTNL